MRDDDRQNGIVHAGEQHGIRTRDAHERETGFVLFGRIAHEAWPAIAAGDDFAQVGEHLAAIANAERERRRAREKRREFLARARAVEQDRFGPALPGAEHVAVREAAAGDQGLESARGSHGLQGCRSMCTSYSIEIPSASKWPPFRVWLLTTLFAQHGDRRAHTARDERCRDILVRGIAQAHVQAGIREVLQPLSYSSRAQAGLSRRVCMWNETSLQTLCRALRAPAKHTAPFACTRIESPRHRSPDPSRGVAQTVARENLEYRVRIAGRDLDHGAELLGETRGNGIMNRAEIEFQTGSARGERHLECGHEHAAVRTVMVGESSSSLRFNSMIEAA